MSFRRYAQEVDPRWLVRIAGSKALSEDPLWLGSSDLESPTHHYPRLQSSEAVCETSFLEGPSEGLEYEEALSYQTELGASSSIC